MIVLGIDGLRKTQIGGELLIELRTGRMGRSCECIFKTPRVVTRIGEEGEATHKEVKSS